MVSGIQVTFDELLGIAYQEPIAGASERPAKTFLVPDFERGLGGDRSSLVREVFRILGEIAEADRPRWLIYENVKGMLSSNRGFDFLAILLEMDELGYDIEWEIFNTKNFGVPQNRERVYTVGRFRAAGRTKIFPLAGADGEDNPVGVEQIGRTDRPGPIVYDDYNGNFRSDNLAGTITPNVGNTAERNGQKVVIPITAEDIDTDHAYNQHGVVHPVNGVSRTIIGGGHEGNESKVAAPIGGLYSNESPSYFHGILDDCSRCLKAKKNDECVALAIPVLTPDRAEKRQNEHPGIYVQLAEDCVVYAVWYKKYGCYIAIRKLTPRECFRLQGWTDDCFDRAEFVNTNSQLYKQAGNGVTVDVVYEIGIAMKEEKE